MQDSNPLLDILEQGLAPAPTQCDDMLRALKKGDNSGKQGQELSVPQIKISSKEKKELRVTKGMGSKEIQDVDLNNQNGSLVRGESRKDSKNSAASAMGLGLKAGNKVFLGVSFPAKELRAQFEPQPAFGNEEGSSANSGKSKKNKGKVSGLRTDAVEKSSSPSPSPSQNKNKKKNKKRKHEVSSLAADEGDGASKNKKRKTSGEQRDEEQFQLSVSKHQTAASEVMKDNEAVTTYLFGEQYLSAIRTEQEIQKEQSKIYPIQGHLLRSKNASPTTKHKTIFKGVKPEPMLFSSFGPLGVAAEKLANAAKSLSILPTALVQPAQGSRVNGNNSGIDKFPASARFETPIRPVQRIGIGSGSLAPIPRVEFTASQVLPAILPPQKSPVGQTKASPPRTRHKSNKPRRLSDMNRIPVSNFLVQVDGHSKEKVSKVIEGPKAKWELEPGRVRARISADDSGDDDEAEMNVAFSSFYVLSKKNGIKMGGKSFRVFTLDMTDKLKFGGQREEQKSLICSMAKGQVKVKIDETEFSISEGGMFRVQGTQKCVVRNQFRERAVIHVVGFNES